VGNLLHSCVEVRETIELSFGVVSVVGPSVWGSSNARGKGVSGGFAEFFSHSFQWCIVKQNCTRLVCEKSTIFPYGQDIVENVFSSAF